jgi:hypothetical protein
MDPKVAAYGAKKIVEVLVNDPDLAPDLKRIITMLMAADLKTLEHRSMDVETAISTLESFDGRCDLLTVVDSGGTRRYLLFI